MSNQININEIFYSLQGEALYTGLPTVFVRLTGCPLRCSYCDTEYAFTGKNILTIDDILTTIKKYNTKYVCVTGGEPLAQKNCLVLLDSLIANNYKVSLETSGSIDISKVNDKVSIVMDIKTPSSNEEKQNKYNNIDKLKAKDQVKFVIGSKDDFNWSVEIINKYKIKTDIFFSPVFNQIEYQELANWILKAQINVRMQLQLHKIIWGDKPGH
jgi:7-carboxy-7-deazaguanine synthase